MELPTTSGKVAAPARKAWLCLFGSALLSAGCAVGQPGPPSLPDPPAMAQRRVDDAIRETRTEANALRAEMAATRIAAAKKEAELQDLRRQIEELQQARTQRHQQHQQQMEARQKELVALRDERDRLQQAQRDVQIQLAELPQLRQTAADAKAIEARLGARMKELEAAVALLITELAQVKKDLAQSHDKRGTKPRTSVKTPGTTPSARNP